MAKRRNKTKRSLRVHGRSSKRKISGVIERSSTFKASPYSAHVEIVITSNIFKSSEKRKLGVDKKDCDGWSGMVCFRGSEYKIFFESSQKEQLSHNTISHEVFHLTHRIMDDTGDRFSIKHQEPYAYLCGYLAQQVYNLCSRWKIKIKI